MVGWCKQSQTTNQLGMGQNPGIHNYVRVELSIGVQSCLTHTQLAQRICSLFALRVVPVPLSSHIFTCYFPPRVFRESSMMQPGPML